MQLICLLDLNMAIAYFVIAVLLINVPLIVDCYEKTLRKIVRNQSKMVQRPFSDGDWMNRSIVADWPPNHRTVAAAKPGYSQVKTLLNKMQRPRISTIITTVDSGTPSAYMRSTIGKNENIIPIELRHPRDAASNNTTAKLKKVLLFPEPNEHENNFTNNHSGDISVETYYEIPTPIKPHSPIIEEHKRRNEDRQNTIIIPESHYSIKENSSSIMKSIFIANSMLNPKPSGSDLKSNSDVENDKVDFLIPEKGMDSASSRYIYNVSVNAYTCTVLQTAAADIDTQERFFRFDIEPPWIPQKHFWSQIFDSRYEYLMRNPKWPPLKVILIPRTHVDSIWKKPFHKYHNDTVSKIISNVVKKLQFYENLTFTWNEVSHLSQWWKTASARSRSAFRRLLKGGRLEITTGGWVEPDEATTHLFGLLHQLIEGHHWLKDHLNYVPSVAWLTNSVAHSPTMAYLMSAAGISKLVLTNLHYSWEEYLAEYQFSDFIWVQNWDKDKSSPSPLNDALNKLGNDRLPKHAIATHFLQFNSAGFQACGPNKAICLIDFDFAKSNKNLDVHSYNIKEKAELLLEQYSKTGTISPHNIIMVPIGDAYRYDNQPEFDYQYNNYQKLADYININQNIYKASIEFGTPKDYFQSILEKHKFYPTVKGDFVNYADLITGSPAYWTGYFTSRPLLKILLRRLESTLRSSEILFSFALSFNAFRGYNNTNLFEMLIKARETVARLTDRNVVSGTLTANAVKYVHRLVLATVKDCWYLQEIAASLMSVKSEKLANVPYLQKYVYRDGEFMSPFRTVTPDDQIYVFNSLSHERMEVVEITVRDPNIRIIDHNKKEVTIQINPVWKYTAQNTIKISRHFFKVIFTIVVPPLTLELYKIKSTYDASPNAATIYCIACSLDDVVAGSGSVYMFNILPIEIGDIQLENYKHRLVFDELTGFLKSVLEKTTNIQKSVALDYGAFKSSDKNSGMFLFNTNVTKPLEDILLPYRLGIKSKIVMIITGQVTTELTNVYGRLLQNTVKIFNLLFGPLSNAIFIESKVDYELSPKNRELELFMSLQTDIANGNPPEIFTDSNGFQYTTRLLNISRRIESNMYPMTSMVYMQDHKSRVTIITEHAQGVTSLQEGNLLLMLDRRVLYNDGRGTEEGLADSRFTCHRHYLLLENFVDTTTNLFAVQDPLHLPSLSAVHLANSLNFVLDLFIVEKKHSTLSQYAFLPLVKTSFPCDVSLINYRVTINRGNSQVMPSSALMILHRQSVSCNIDHALHVLCNGETQFSLDHILYNIKAIYQTNLVGTSKGVAISNLNQVNFPAMELTTLRIHF